VAPLGNRNALSHGATSVAQIRPLARNHRRRLLRRFRIRASDLDPISRGYLDLLSRTLAKIELADAWIEQHGMLREGGEPAPVMKLYVSLVNSASRTLSRLEGHIAKAEPDGLAVLEAEGRRLRLAAERELEPGA
jgi:hypothetical protein